MVDLFKSNRPGTKKIYKHLQNRRLRKVHYYVLQINSSWSQEGVPSRPLTTPEVVNWHKTPASLQLGQCPGKLMNENGLICRGKRQIKPVQVIDNYYLVFNSYMYLYSLKTQQQPWE